MMNSATNAFPAFNGFISERECTAPAPTSSSSTSVHTSITLFDAIILAKRNRGRLLPSARQLSGMSLTSSMKSGLSASSRLAASALSSAHRHHNMGGSTNSVTVSSEFLSDTSDHTWRTISATGSSATSPAPVTRTDFGDPSRDYREVVTRVPAKLEEIFMREPPRVIQGIPSLKVKRDSSAASATLTQQKNNSSEEESFTGQDVHGQTDIQPPPQPQENSPSIPLRSMNREQQPKQQIAPHSPSPLPHHSPPSPVTRSSSAQQPLPQQPQSSSPQPAKREKINGLALHAPDPMPMSLAPREGVVSLISSSPSSLPLLNGIPPTMNNGFNASASNPARRSRTTASTLNGAVTSAGGGR